MIFDGTAQVMRTIDDEAKTYTEMTKADVEKLSGQMSGAMAQMQEQMKNMPPEARAAHGSDDEGARHARRRRARRPSTRRSAPTRSASGPATSTKAPAAARRSRKSARSRPRPRVHAVRLRGDEADGGVLRQAGAAGRRPVVPCRGRDAERLLRAAGPHRHVPQRRAGRARRRSPTSAGRTFPIRRSPSRPAIRSAT